MPLHLPTRRPFSTAAPSQPALPLRFYTQAPQAPAAKSASKLGRIGRWYLPSMFLVAVGIAVANGLNEYRGQALLEAERLREENERQRKIMEAFAGRDSLEELEKAMEAYEVQ